MPRHVPQVLDRLPRKPVVQTTLHLPLQSALERLAADRLAILPDRASVAILVADIASRHILALIAGEAGNTRRAGSLDLTRAVRSPGSAMKPFIYAMAFADGFAGAQTILADLPQRFGAYAPEDFDRFFSGHVTAADALRRSLNMPAVEMLQGDGYLRYAATLQAAGVTLRIPAGAEPSLPLALGAAGTTLRDVAALYAALAADGRMAPLSLLPGAPGTRPLLEADAARNVAAILTEPFPTGGPAGVAWKTGTSWGGRDAWAFGFDRAHVAGVWIGRPDGTPLPGATGATLASPILAQIYEILPSAPRPAPTPAMPESTLFPSADSLRLLFPPDAAVLSGCDSVTVRVMGGRRPLTFLVDGQLLPTEPVRREARWTPAGPGFYRLTVIDADGADVQI